MGRLIGFSVVLNVDVINCHVVLIPKTQGSLLKLQYNFQTRLDYYQCCEAKRKRKIYSFIRQKFGELNYSQYDFMNK